MERGRLVHRAGIPLVYDIDDMVQLPHSSAANPFMRWLRSRDKPLELMRIADHVVVCTEHLAEIARRENDAVTNISSKSETRCLPMPISISMPDMKRTMWCRKDRHLKSK